jgi:hypothetical protein
VHPLTGFLVIIVIIIDTKLVIIIKVIVGTKFGASNNRDKDEMRRPTGKKMNELEKRESLPPHVGNMKAKWLKRQKKARNQN